MSVEKNFKCLSCLLFYGLLASLLLAGCAPVEGVVKQRFFWPLPVDGVEPKIEYLGFYQSDKDLEVHGPGWVESAVLGEYPPFELFQSPYYIATLTGGRLAVSDTVARKVKILDLKKGVVRELMGNEGSPFAFSLPMGVVGDESGAVLVVDSLRGEIFKFGADEKYVETFGGKSILGHPLGISLDERGKRFCVTDVVEHNIAFFDLWGNLLYKIGERGAGPGQFNFPTDVSFDEAGNVFVLDALNYRVQVLDDALQFKREFGELGTAAGSFRLPKGLAVSPHGQVYITDGLAHKVVVFDHQGAFLLSLGDKTYSRQSGEITPGGFFAPRGVAVDAAGEVLVVDGINRMVQRFQYLTEDYLQGHPVRDEEIYLPPALRQQPRTPFAPVSSPSEKSND
ncbi:6-bladed beta-propeller [Deltaproteobacteria bacterium IMCC39524]|nr:6-bladed beta-propeller [Deltaproteobacteria bacterium IMCC39524]